MQPINKFFTWLDGTSMYRTVLYALTFLFLGALALAVGGKLPYGITTTHLLESFAILMSVSIATHEVYRRIYGAPANIESSFITAFILLFVALPPEDTKGALWLALLAFTAISSKYVVAWKNRHIFNPSAFALVALGVLGAPIALWWVGSPWIAPLVLLAGLAVVKKLRRFTMVGTYLLVSFVLVMSMGLSHHEPLLSLVRSFFLSWPAIYFATFMLTEPLTKPPTDKLRIIYAALIAIIGVIPARFDGYAMTPELALCLGNLFTLAVGMRSRVALSLVSRKSLASDTEEFVFKPDSPIAREAGQYLEWTLPHENPDLRGIRRYFTIASSPSDEYIRLGTKFVTAGLRGSSFKNTLRKLAVGDKMWVTARAGSFTLPFETETPLVFIAGGIGITPFVSMLRSMLAQKENRKVTLFCANKTLNDIAYGDVIKEAEDAFEVKTIHVLNDLKGAIGEGFESGFITPEMIKKYADDYKNALFYLSGPSMMVDNYKSMLRGMGVPRSHIKTDYFPGFA